jgi:hypothetical protein
MARPKHYPSWKADQVRQEGAVTQGTIYLFKAAVERTSGNILRVDRYEKYKDGARICRILDTRTGAEHYWWTWEQLKDWRADAIEHGIIPGDAQADEIADLDRRILDRHRPGTIDRITGADTEADVLRIFFGDQPWGGDEGW